MAGAVLATDSQIRILADPSAEISRCVPGTIFLSIFWPNGVFQQNQWIKTLRDYAFPVIGARKVNEIQSGDILRVLQPIWLEKPAIAVRVRQRLRSVFDWAIAAQHRTAGNPVNGIQAVLPKQPKADRHHAAMPFEEIPRLFSQLGDSSAALCLQFLILTAARSSEARLAVMVRD